MSAIVSGHPAFDMQEHAGKTHTVGNCFLFEPYGDNGAFDVVCHTSDPHWASLRSDGIGASDSPNCFGEGFATSSELAVWAEKCGLEPTWFDDTGDHLEIGKLVENAILAMFCKRTEMPATACGYMLRSKRYPWLTATLDGQVLSDPTGQPCIVPIELKNVFGFSAKHWEHEAPARVQLQLQHQLIVTGAPHGYIAAFIGGGKFVWQLVPAEPYVQLRIIEATRRLWEAIEAKQAPRAGASAADAKVLREIYKHAIYKPSDAIDLPDNLLALDKDIEDASAQETAAKARKQAARNTIFQTLMERKASAGKLSSGVVYKIAKNGTLRRNA